MNQRRSINLQGFEVFELGQHLVIGEGAKFVVMQHPKEIKET